VSEEKIDIEVIDKVATTIEPRVLAIAAALEKTDTSVNKLKASLASINSNGLTQLRTALSASSNDLTRAISTAQRYETAQEKAALGAAKLAKETANAARAQSQAEAAALRLATAQAKNEQSSLRAASASEKAANAALAQMRATNEANAAAKASSFQNTINTRLGVDKPISSSAQSSAGVFQAEGRAAAELEARVNSLRSSIDPLHNAQQRLNRELGEASDLFKRGAISAGEQGRAIAAAERNYKTTSGALQSMGKNASLSSNQLLTLQYTANDVAASLASGGSPLTILMQQGGQVTQSFGGIKNSVTAIGGAILRAPITPWALGGAAAFGLLHSEVEKVAGKSVTMGDTIKAVMQVSTDAIMNLLAPAIKFLGPYFKQAYDFINSEVRKAVNQNIGAWVGAFNVIKDTWKQWPATIGDLFYSGVNAAIETINRLIKASVDGLNSLIAQANSKVLNQFGVPISELTAGTVGIVANPFEGAAAKTTQTAQTSWQAGQQDYAGQFVGAVGRRAGQNRNAREYEEGKEAREKAQREAEQAEAERRRKATQAANEARRLAEQAENERKRKAKAAAEEAERIAKAAAKAAQDRADALSGVNTGLSEELRLMGFLGPQREIEAKMSAVLADMAGRKITLTVAETKAIRDKIAANEQEGRVASIRQQVYNETAGTMQLFADTQLALNKLLADGTITQQEYTRRVNMNNDAKERALDPLLDYKNAIVEELALLRFSGKELEVQTELWKAYSAAKALGYTNNFTTFAAANRSGAEGLVDARNDARVNRNRDGAIDNIRGEGARDSARSSAWEAAEAESASRRVIENKALMYAEIDKLRQRDVISEQEAIRAKGRIDEQVNRARFAQTSQFLGGLVELQNSSNKKLRAIGKAAAIAQASIDTYVAANKALAAFPPPFNFAAAALVVAGGIANVAKIAGYERGGYTGNYGRKEVAGVVHGREFVVNADATARNRALLEAINDNRPVQGYEGGGHVGNSPTMYEPPKGYRSGNNGVAVYQTFHIDAKGAQVGVEERIEAVLEQHREEVIREARKLAANDRAEDNRRQRIGG
jgi:hypothetical protein